jgi:hypothetical protein
VRGTYPDDALLNILASPPHLSEALLAVTAAYRDDTRSGAVVLGPEVILCICWGFRWLGKKEWKVLKSLLG